MKKLLLYASLFFACTYSLTSVDPKHKEDHSSHTFLYPRPAFGSLGMQQASWNAIAYEKEHKRGGAFQVTMFYDQSYDTNNEVEYFLFNNKNSLNLSGGTGTQNNYTQGSIYTQTLNRDILGQWVGITDNTFSENFTLTPKQRQTGLMFEYSQDLKDIIDLGIFRYLYLGVSIPFMLVENDLLFEGHQDIFKTFSNQTGNSWDFLLLPQEKQSSVTLSNIRLTLGTTQFAIKDILISTSSSLIVPMTRAVDNRKMFEPVQGYNGAFALASQALFQFPILKRDEYSLSRICFYFGFENTFTLTNKMNRTMDLKNKPYSRYMLLYDKITNETVPGINILTKKCEVDPYNFVNIILGLRFNYGKAIGEIGYEYWGHAPESVKLHKDDPWTEGRYGIAYIDNNGDLIKTTAANTNGGDRGLTASKSTINYVEFADGNPLKNHTPVLDNAANKVDPAYNIYIKESDIDFNSAASQKTHVHRPYVTLGLRGSKANLDIFVNLGAYLSVSYHNSALSTYGFWMKAGASF